MNSVTEQSVCYIDVSFFDKTDAPAVPSLVKWKVHDGDGTEIVEEQRVSNLDDPNMTIELDSTVNTFEDNDNRREYRVVTVEAEFTSPTDKVTSSYEYFIIAMRHIP